MPIGLPCKPTSLFSTKWRVRDARAGIEHANMNCQQNEKHREIERTAAQNSRTFQSREAGGLESRPALTILADGERWVHCERASAPRHYDGRQRSQQRDRMPHSSPSTPQYAPCPHLIAFCCCLCFRRRRDSTRHSFGGVKLQFSRDVIGTLAVRRGRSLRTQYILWYWPIRSSN